MRITISIDEMLVEKLKRKAKREKMSLHDYIVKILDDAFSRKEKHLSQRKIKLSEEEIKMAWEEFARIRGESGCRE